MHLWEIGEPFYFKKSKKEDLSVGKSEIAVLLGVVASASFASPKPTKIPSKIQIFMKKL